MSRVSFGAKPLTIPQPVLILATYDAEGKPNAMNAAWGVTTDMKEVTISLSDHKTTDNLKVTGAFTISFATKDQVTACDYVGVISGRKEPEKFAKAGFTAVKSEHVNAPLIQQLPVAMECTVKSFEDGILIGEIVDVVADESVLTDGKLDYAKLQPIAYDPFNRAYVEVGGYVARAYSEGMKLK